MHYRASGSILPSTVTQPAGETETRLKKAAAGLPVLEQVIRNASCFPLLLFRAAS